MDLNNRKITNHPPFQTNHYDFKKLRPFYNLPQPHHVTASHTSQGYNPPERGRAVWKNTTPSKNVLSTPSYRPCIVAQPPLSFFCCPRSPSRHLSNQPNLGQPCTHPPLTSAIIHPLQRYNQGRSTVLKDLEKT